MKRLISLVFIASLSIPLFAQTSRHAAPAQKPAEAPKREVLTNDSIISLVRAGFKEKTILHRFVEAINSQLTEIVFKTAFVATR